MTRKTTIFALAIAFFMQYSVLLAQELAVISPDDSTKSVDFMDMSLEEMMNMKITTTSRTGAEKSNDAPATVRVVTEDMINKRGYMSLLDVLRDLPEFKIDFGVDPRWMNDITLRGIRGMDKFIILLDGVRISSPTNDIIAVMENYPVHMAKQIEVVYGPASALYGADAFSGVINIITKKNDNEIRGINLNAQLRGGMYNTYLGNLHLSYKFSSKVEFNVGGQYFFDAQPPLENFYKKEYGNTDSILQSGTFPTIFGPITPKAPIDKSKNNNLSAYAAYFNLYIGDFKISYFRNYSRSPSTQANSPANAVYNDASYFGHIINNININYNKSISEKISLNSFLIFNRYDLDNKSNFRNVFTNMEPAYLFAYGWMAKAEQLVSYKANDKFSITAGATYEYYTSVPRSNNLQNPLSGDATSGILVNSIDVTQTPNGIPVDLVKINYQNIGALVQMTYKPIKKVIITAGLRSDNYIYAKPEDKYLQNAEARTLSTLNPRIGVVYNPDSMVTLKAMFGTAFLAPSPQNMFDRYGTFNFNNSGSGLPPVYSFFFQLPNAQLKPQRLTTLEFTAKIRPTKNSSIGITPYYTMITDLISPVSDTNRIQSIYPTKTYAGYPIIGGIQINDNLGTQNVYGITFETDYLISFNSRFNILPYLSVSYTDGTIDIDGSGPLAPRDLRGVSPLSSKIGGTTNIGKFSLSINMLLFSDQRTFDAASVKASEPTKYQTIDGYFLLNANASFRATKWLNFFVQGSNLLDQRYRNVNIGAAPESAGAGSSAVEFANGMPQYPVRVQLGVQARF
ncbi:MAG: TonB-dependent receptor plug domain-containing protein [Cytophagales bacterium]